MQSKTTLGQQAGASAGSGMQVTLIEGEGQASSEVKLTVQGITSTGYLLAVDAAGQACELHPDGNRCGMLAHALYLVT